MEVDFSILLRLLTAHVLAEFFFQPRGWVDRKRKRNVLEVRFWYHIGIVGITTYLLLMDWDNWQIPLLVMVSHTLIDSIRIKVGKDTTTAFLMDQMAHMTVIIGIWILLLVPNELLEQIPLAFIFKDERWWVFLLGYLLNTLPAAVLIRYLTRHWSHAMEEPETGLRDAGKYIGILERILIFTFILMNELRAIGFLLAAKSVFRFGDLKDNKDRKKTEYILLGTLLSFVVSILLGLLLRFMI